MTEVPARREPRAEGAALDSASVRYQLTVHGNDNPYDVITSGQILVPSGNTVPLGTHSAGLQVCISSRLSQWPSKNSALRRSAFFFPCRQAKMRGSKPLGATV